MEYENAKPRLINVRNIELNLDSKPMVQLSKKNRRQSHAHLNNQDNGSRKASLYQKRHYENGIKLSK